MALGVAPCFHFDPVREPVMSRTANVNVNPGTSRRTLTHNAVKSPYDITVKVRRRDAQPAKRAKPGPNAMMATTIACNWPRPRSARRQSLTPRLAATPRRHVFKVYKVSC
jgi:hypothetical protein